MGGRDFFSACFDCGAVGHVIAQGVEEFRRCFG